MTEKERFELRLNLAIANGEMTIEEAEDEWQNKYNPDPRYCGQEW